MEVRLDGAKRRPSSAGSSSRSGHERRHHRTPARHRRGRFERPTPTRRHRRNHTAWLLAQVLVVPATGRPWHRQSVPCYYNRPTTARPLASFWGDRPWRRTVDGRPPLAGDGPRPQVEESAHRPGARVPGELPVLGVQGRFPAVHPTWWEWSRPRTRFWPCGFWLTPFAFTRPMLGVAGCRGGEDRMAGVRTRPASASSRCSGRSSRTEGPQGSSGTDRDGLGGEDDRNEGEPWWWRRGRPSRSHGKMKR
jgi:hypothetical protein